MTQPNAMQFTPSGTLLLLDQRDPNHVFEVVADSGKDPAQRCRPNASMAAASPWTRTATGSSNSTKAPAGASAPSTLIINPKDGSTIKKFGHAGLGGLLRRGERIEWRALGQP